MMGPSPAKPGVVTSPGPEEYVFYGVFVPTDVLEGNEDNEGVFSDKSEALKLVKKYKKARFKAFRCREDALQFSIFGPDTAGPAACSVTSIESGEKPSPFRGPKPQDMVRFRKAIEAGDIDFVKKIVWENPRYLVSSGDTPAILQEGSRYNALHIAAKSRDATICAYILQTVNNTEFMAHFYGDSSDLNQRCAILLDLYLNTPDKGLNETPLHFASKYGAASVVNVLVAYPQCDKSATNKYNQTANQVICSRMAGSDSSLKNEISSMLSEQFYVPVLRSPDCSIEPIIGHPFSPTSEQMNWNSGDILSPPLEMQALAGPMPRQTADLFRRRWKTPPRVPGSPLRMCRPTLTDQNKGWEKVGRELAQEWKVPWKEYWPFLDSHTDLSTPEGLQLLEDYLQKCFKNAIESPIHHIATDVKKVTPPTPVSPISELCSALQACRLSSNGTRTSPRQLLPRHHTHQHVAHNGVASHDSIPVQFNSPHLYMERSCQVFAKRIVDGFSLSDDLDFLTIEVKHLNVLVTSCQNDNRFSQLDFSRLHSHLGRLVAARLEDFDLPRIMDSLRSLIKRKSDLCSSDEDEAVDLPYRRQQCCDTRDQLALRAAVVCLAQSILYAKEPPTTLMTEQTCIDAWEEANPCSCTFFPNRHVRRKFTQKKLNFNEDYDNSECPRKSESGELAKCISTPADSSGEESDTSDTSESEYFTPPSSPGILSDDDQAMESTDEGPDVYINGNVPSKLDIAVLDAIGTSEINRTKFPNICRWQHLVLLHSEKERQSWMDTPKHNRLSTGVSPMWQGTPSLRHN